MRVTQDQQPVLTKLLQIQQQGQASITTEQLLSPHNFSEPVFATSGDDHPLNFFRSANEII